MPTAVGRFVIMGRNARYLVKRTHDHGRSAGRAVCRIRGKFSLGWPREQASVRLGLVEVISRYIKVKLLRVRSVWPLRRAVILDLLKRQHEP